MTRKKRKQQIDFEDSEARASWHEGEFITREAKRKRRPQKIRSHVDDDDDGGAGKGRKKRKGGSAFEEDLANVKRQNVKRLRHKGNARGGRAAAKR